MIAQARRIAAAAALLTLSVPGRAPAGDAGTPSAAQYYEAAVAAMRVLPEPAYATFTTRLTGTGLTPLIEDADGQVGLGLAWCDCPGGDSESFATAYRSSDRRASIRFENGARATTEFSPFDPTWSAAYDWARYGLFAQGGKPAPPAASIPPPGGLPTIATTTAIASSAYAVSDGGAQRCENGDPGHRLHLAARFDPQSHPLIDAVVDTANARFCTMRFRVYDDGPLFSATGYVELHYGAVASFWLTTDAVVDLLANVRNFGRKHGVIRADYEAMAFPERISEATFAP